MDTLRRLPFTVADWHADPRLDVLSRDGTQVKLVPKTMEVLTHLAYRAGEVVSQEELEAAVWGGVVVTPSSVYQAIADVRRALGDTPREPRYIATVPRKGYRLIAPVRWDSPEPDDTHEQVVAEKTPRLPEPAPPVIPSSPARTRFHRARLAGALALLVAVVIAIGVIWTFRHASPEMAPSPSSRSIAVLPIADLSDEAPRDERFVDGLTEEVLNTLAQVPGLQVTARTSAFIFKNHNEDVRTIGRKLGTRYVLEGSVRRANGRIRMVAQLIDTQTGFHIWSKSFDRAAGDVLSVQSELALAVADSLQVTLSDESMSRIAARSAVRMDAYELYLIGRHHQLERTPASLQKAIAFQEQAIAIDPHFALAYAGLADAHMATHYYANRNLNEVASVIEPLIERGLAINAKLPELFAARAVLRLEMWQLDLAEQDLHRAIELNPNYAEVHVRLAAALEYEGRPRDALSALERAAKLDPMHFILHVRRCLTLQNLGRYPQAKDACNRAIELQPDLPNGYWTRGLIALSSGDHAAAIAGYREALERAPQRVDLLDQLGLLYLDLDLRTEAAHAFDSAVAAMGNRPNEATLTGSRRFIEAGDLTGLRRFLDDPALHAAADSGSLLDLAELELVAGRTRAARGYAERAMRAADYAYPRLQDVWAARWGRSDILTLALLAHDAGDQASSERYLADLDAWVTKLERNGHVWHGLHYLRASILAQRDRTSEALAELEKATALGWRRGWWARNDPALAPLRSSPRFTQWLASLDESNALMRASMSREPATP